MEGRWWAGGGGGGERRERKVRKRIRMSMFPTISHALKNRC